MTRIAVVGGHGKIARQLHPMLLGAGHEPVALVRRPEQADALGATGVTTRMLDIEGEDADRFAAAFEGCDAVVFAAGGGPDGNIERKRTVDLEGSLKSIEGARPAGIRRFVQVSAISVDEPLPDDASTGLEGVRRGQARRRRRAARQRPRLDDPAARDASPTTRRPAGSRSVPTSRAARSPAPTSPRWWPPSSTSGPRRHASGTWSPATRRRSVAATR